MDGALKLARLAHYVDTVEVGTGGGLGWTAGGSGIISIAGGRKSWFVDFQECHNCECARQTELVVLFL